MDEREAVTVTGLSDLGMANQTQDESLEPERLKARRRGYLV